MLAACGGPHETIAEDSELLIDFLSSMSEQLLNPSRTTDVSRLLLRVASRFFERAILFVVKDDLVAGLAGFGLGRTDAECFAAAQRLSFPLEDSMAFAEVVRTRTSQRLGAPGDGLTGSIHCRIDRGRARECYLGPLLNNGEVLAILYGDNAGTGKPLGKLRGLELFMAQATVALENIFLQRKLRDFEIRLRGGENQRQAS
jgi:GAF domain-containing protein